MAQITITSKEKIERIERELHEAGVYNPQRHPFTSNYLPRTLHDDEHIMAAVFGRRKESEGFFGFVEGMLVATDKRVIFLDHRPGYTTMDEVSYDNVSGVNLSTTLLYASVTLFTKIANYKLSFANHVAAQRFTDYVESHVIDQRPAAAAASEKPSYEVVIADEAREFMETHEVGVLSSIERTGIVSGATVYYTMRGSYPYFITKENSRKADNIMGNQHVALTIFDEAKLQTMQLQGIVEQVHDDKLKMEVTTAIVHPRTYKDGSRKPPILRIGPGGIQTYRIVPTKFNFVDYSKR